MYHTANNVSNIGGDPVTQIIVNVYQMKFTHTFPLNCHCYPLDGCTMQSGNYPCLPPYARTSLSNSPCTIMSIALPTGLHGPQLEHNVQWNVNNTVTHGTGGKYNGEVTIITGGKFALRNTIWDWTRVTAMVR